MAEGGGQARKMLSEASFIKVLILSMKGEALLS
jgi:hypothetical protein